MRVLLIGDLHFFRTRLSLGEWLSKRVLGQANLLRNRRHQFAHRLWPAMLGRALAQKPDVAVLTGDLSTTALGREFSDARAALAPLAAAGVPMLAVPGNHDRYTFTAARRKVFEAFFGGRFGAPPAYPALKPLGGRWHALLMDSACPRFFSSRGRLGAAALAQAKQLLRQVPAGDGVLVVCHYPALVPIGHNMSWNRGLDDMELWLELLSTENCKVVYVHGHIHHPWHLTPAADGVPFDSINAGAPCQIKDGHGRNWPAGQGLWLLDLPEDPAQTVACRPG